MGYSSANLENAVALHKQGKLQDAMQGYHEVLKQNSADTDALNLLGLACSQSGNHQQGVEYLRTAIELKNHPMYQNNLGCIYRKMNQFDQAKDCLERALEVAPDYLDAVTNLASLLSDTGDISAAQTLYQSYYEAGKDRSDFLYNYSKLCRKTGDFEQAGHLLEQLLQHYPNDVNGLFNYATLLKAQGKISLATEPFSRLLFVDPTNKKAEQIRWYLSQCYLLQKNFTDGWPDYSTRFSALGLMHRHFELPYWDGNNLKETGLLVWAEQGLGEELMFSTHIPLIVKKCATIYYECDARLLDLFSRTYPEIHFFPRYTEHVCEEFIQQSGYQCSIGDMPKLLNPRLDPLGTRFRPLRADEKRIAQIKARLGNLAERKSKVGISYHTKGVQAEFRMPPSDFWKTVFQHPEEMLLVDLQHNRNTQTSIPNDLQEQGLLMPVEGIDLYNDLEGLAALIVSLDSVVSIDNAVAHLAGCLNISTKILLSTVHDWRWFLQDSHSPWYPSVNLLRQEAINNWADVQQGLCRSVK